MFCLHCYDVIQLKDVNNHLAKLGTSRGETRLEMCELIIKLYKEKKFLREIAITVDIKRFTIQYVIKIFKITGNVKMKRVMVQDLKK